MTEKIVLENDDTFVYYVDIEKGVVVAVMEEPRKEAKPFFTKIDRIEADHAIVLIDLWDLKDKFSSPIRGKATCSENDEFDIEFGMELARKRCLAKYYKKLTQFYVELNNRIDPVLSYVEDMCIVCSEKYSRFSEQG